jgi:hypothetical protein
VEQAAVQKDVGEGLPDAQAVDDRVGYQTEGQNDQVKGAVAAQQQIREGLHQKNAGTNQDDQLDAGGDESAPIEVVAARAERRRHNGSVRRETQRRQSASSTCGVDGCDGTPERCGMALHRANDVENSRR